LIGARGFLVYSAYCRLAREGEVKALSQRDLAKSLRIGPNSLKQANELLEELRFIEVAQPTSYQRSMHWTLCVTVLEPPTEVPPEVIEKYGHPSGYAPLSQWLVKESDLCDNLPEKEGASLGSDAIASLGSDVTSPDSNANIEDLDIEDLKVEDLDKDGANALLIEIGSMRKGLRESEALSPEEQAKAQSDYFERMRKLRDDYAPDLPVDFLVAHLIKLSSEDQSEAAVQADKLEKQVLKSRKDRDETYIQNMRSWMPVALIDMAIAFFEASGKKKAIGEGERSGWIKAFSRMDQRGITPKDIRLGIKRMREKSMFISSPFSVEKSADNQRVIRERYEQQTFGKKLG
jgi:hypothetical protein